MRIEGALVLVGAMDDVSALHPDTKAAAGETPGAQAG